MMGTFPLLAVGGFSGGSLRTMVSHGGRTRTLAETRRSILRTAKGVRKDKAGCEEQKGAMCFATSGALGLCRE